MQIVNKKARNASEITRGGIHKITEYASRGFCTLDVAKGSADGPINGIQWEAVGLLPLHDPPRHDTGETIRRCIQKVTSCCSALCSLFLRSIFSSKIKIEVDIRCFSCKCDIVMQRVHKAACQKSPYSSNSRPNQERQ